MSSLSGWKSRHTHSPHPRASGPLLLISPQASDSSLKGTDAGVRFCSLLLRLNAALSLIAGALTCAGPNQGRLIM